MVGGFCAIFLGDSVLERGEPFFEIFFGVFVHLGSFFAEELGDGSEEIHYKLQVGIR